MRPTACAQAFWGPDALVLTSLVPAHAIMVAIARVANAVTARQPSRSLLQRQALHDLRARGRARLKRAASSGKKDAVADDSAEASATPLSELGFIRLTRRTIRLEGAPLLWLGGWLESVLLAVGLTGAFVWRVTHPTSMLLPQPLPVVDMDDAWFLAVACYAALKAVHWLLAAGDG